MGKCLLHCKGVLNTKEKGITDVKLGVRGDEMGCNSAKDINGNLQLIKADIVEGGGDRSCCISRSLVLVARIECRLPNCIAR